MGQELEDISVMKSIKSKEFSGIGLTDNELDFKDAFEINEAIKNGEPVTSEELDLVSRYSNMFEAIGTEDEREVMEALQKTGGAFEIAKAQFPSKDSMARIAGRNEGAGLLDQDARANLMQAMQNIKVSTTGDFDFESAVTEFERLQSATAAKREAIKTENPESFEQAKLASEITTAIAGGGLVQKGIGSALTAIPKVGASPVMSGIAESAAAGAGAAASELLTNKDLNTIAEAGLTGVALDTALRTAHPAAKLGSRKLREFLDAGKEKSLDSAARMAVRAVAPIKRPLLRALSRTKDGVEGIGRHLLQEKVIPPFPPFFLTSSIDKRLAKARKKAGEALGTLRKEAEDFNDLFINKLRKEADFSVTNSRGELTTGTEKVSEVMASIDDIEKKLRFDPNRVADRLQDYIDSIDPLARNSERGGVAARIQKNIDDFRNDPNPRSISSAIKLKEQFRSKIQKQGALSPAITVEADGIVNRIMADEIDQAITKSLTLKKRLGNNFNSRNVEAEFGQLATDLERGIKALERGGATPEEIQDVVNTMSELDDMGSVFRAIAKSGDLLLEKNLSQQTNNIISLRDSLAASAGFQAMGPEAAIGGAVLSNFLRSRGSATGAKGMQFLSGAVDSLNMSVGSFTGGIKLMSDMKTLTPALYVAITRPDSPLNVHNFMVIDDAEFLEEFKARIAEDESVSTVRRANLISEINKTGEVKIFKKPAKDENDVNSSPGLEGFRKRLESFIPHNESPMAPPGAPAAGDFSQSPLKGIIEEALKDSPIFGKKKAGTPTGHKIGNLPMGKQIQGFLDTMMGTEQIGLDPQETFPEGQISPEELAAMQAQAGILIKGKFGKGAKEAVESSIEETKKLRAIFRERFTAGDKALSQEEAETVRKGIARIIEIEAIPDHDPVRVTMLLKGLKKLGVTEKVGIKEARRKAALEKLKKESPPENDLDKDIDNKFREAKRRKDAQEVLESFDESIDLDTAIGKLQRFMKSDRGTFLLKASISKSGKFVIRRRSGKRFSDGSETKQFNNLEDAKEFVEFGDI